MGFLLWPRIRSQGSSSRLGCPSRRTSLFRPLLAPFSSLLPLTTLFFFLPFVHTALRPSLPPRPLPPSQTVPPTKSRRSSLSRISRNGPRQRSDEIERPVGLLVGADGHLESDHGGSEERRRRSLGFGTRRERGASVRGRTTTPAVFVPGGRGGAAEEVEKGGGRGEGGGDGLLIRFTHFSSFVLLSFGPLFVPSLAYSPSPSPFSCTPTDPFLSIYSLSISSLGYTPLSFILL